MRSLREELRGVFSGEANFGQRSGRCKDMACHWEGENGTLQRSSHCKNVAAGTLELFTEQQERPRTRAQEMGPKGLDKG